MPGLLDFLSSPDAQFGLGLLGAAAPRAGGVNFGQGLQEALGYVDKQRQMKAAEMAQAQAMKLQDMQMVDHEQKRAREQSMQGLAQRFATPAIGAAADGYGPTAPASFDRQGYGAALESIDPMAGMAYMQSIQKQDPKMTVVAPGGSLVNERTGQALFTAPKEFNKPAEQQGYELAQSEGYKGSFLDYQMGLKRAGATNVTTKIDNKMGESLAGQVGPMAKDSRIQTQGAVKMFDSANRLEAALNSDKVTSGPFASQIQTVKQLVQVIGGGNDDGIRQTRQAIKSLAQMSVEARKQLQGQGQVTESEAAAVAKADSGDINDLTTGELKDLVTLTKRAAHYQAKSHADLMGTLGGKQETQGLVPFYNVQGTEALLKHSPELPKIGGNGGWSIKPVGQ